MPLRDGPLGGSQQAVVDAVVALGASAEAFGKQFNIVAVTVPADSDLAAIKRALQRGEDDGSWSYEEACVTEMWTSA